MGQNTFHVFDRVDLESVGAFRGETVTSTAYHFSDGDLASVAGFHKWIDNTIYTFIPIRE